MSKELFLQLLFFSILITSCKKDDVLLLKKLSAEIISGKAGSGTGNGSKLGSMRDLDGNTYKTVTIGSQIWMAENLKVSRYKNGDPILNIKDDNEWIYTTHGVWCTYGNSADVDQSYGKLYNWSAVNDPRGLAPKGWHIPTAQEINILLETLGGASTSGNAMKETGNIFWYYSSGISELITNSSGFSARPGGYRHYSGIFSDIKSAAWFWTSTVVSDSDGAFFSLGYQSTACATDNWSKIQGLSVRCIKD